MDRNVLVVPIAISYGVQAAKGSINSSAGKSVDSGPRNSSERNNTGFAFVHALDDWSVR
jgi:hypothetical protein